MMKKITKRVLAVLLVCMMLTTAFVGCSKKNDSKGSTQAKPGVTEGTTTSVTQSPKDEFISNLDAVSKFEAFEFDIAVEANDQEIQFEGVIDKKNSAIEMTATSNNSDLFTFTLLEGNLYIDIDGVLSMEVEEGTTLGDMLEGLIEQANLSKEIDVDLISTIGFVGFSDLDLGFKADEKATADLEKAIKAFADSLVKEIKEENFSKENDEISVKIDKQFANAVLTAVHDNIENLMNALMTYQESMLKDVTAEKMYDAIMKIADMILSKLENQSMKDLISGMIKDDSFKKEFIEGFEVGLNAGLESAYDAMSIEDVKSEIKDEIESLNEAKDEETGVSFVSTFTKDNDGLGSFEIEIASTNEDAEFAMAFAIDEVKETEIDAPEYTDFFEILNIVVDAVIPFFFVN